MPYKEQSSDKKFAIYKREQDLDAKGVIVIESEWQKSILF